MATQRAIRWLPRIRFHYASGWEAVTTATSDFCPNPVVGSFAVALCNDVRTYQLAVVVGGAPVYGFIFADPNAPPRGPVHTAELQYLFLTSVPLKPQSKALSETMVRYWSNFIKSAATRLGIPIPGFSSALSYYDALRTERLPAALTQGLRDFFGAHLWADRRAGQDSTPCGAETTPKCPPSGTG